jgi:hypothetical protein
MNLSEIAKQEIGFLKNDLDSIWARGPRDKIPVCSFFLSLPRMAVTVLIIPGYVLGFLARIKGFSQGKKE